MGNNFDLTIEITEYPDGDCAVVRRGPSARIRGRTAVNYQGIFTLNQNLTNQALPRRTFELHFVWRDVIDGGDNPVHRRDDSDSLQAARSSSLRQGRPIESLVEHP